MKKKDQNRLKQKHYLTSTITFGFRQTNLHVYGYCLRIRCISYCGLESKLERFLIEYEQCFVDTCPEIRILFVLGISIFREIVLLCMAGIVQTILNISRYKALVKRTNPLPKHQMLQFLTNSIYICCLCLLSSFCKTNYLQWNSAIQIPLKHPALNPFPTR